jgi:hypothetical protein
MGEIVTSTAAGAFVADGAYVYEEPNAVNVPQGPATNVVAINGCFTDGPVNIPTPISTSNGSAALLGAFGTGTVIPYAGLREALSAMPECASFLINRVTDGTDTPAVIDIVDGSAGVVATLTAIVGGPNGHTGTTGNAATARLDFQSQNTSGGGVYQLTIQWPNNVAETFQGIVSSATPTGPYAAATFRANLLAAVNNGSNTHAKSSFMVAAAGASSIAPEVATVFTAAGGTNGTNSAVTDTLIGTDGMPGTGMYAFRGQSFGVLVMAALTDVTAAPLIAEFLAQTGGLGTFPFPSGTATATAIATKNTDNLSNQRLIDVMDWDYVNDTLSGNPNLLVSPSGAVAGIIASLPPYLSPSNKPVIGKLGILGTERTLGQPVDPFGEGALRQQNGIIWLTNQMPRGGGLLGLPHGQASDGSNICDTRMLDVIAQALLAILGQYVGLMQTPPPVGGAPDRDATRSAVLGSIINYFRTLTNPANPQIVSASVNFTGTLVQVQQGFLPYAISVTTLSAVKFALASLQVGNALSVWTPTTSG